MILVMLAENQDAGRCTSKHHCGGEIKKL